MSWERVIENSGPMPTVHRVAVPGGWLYAAYNAMVFVPEPKDKFAYERGHKAGYMQALANHEGDKVTPDRGFDAGYNEATIEAKANYDRAYNEGFNAAMQRFRQQGDKVTPDQYDYWDRHTEPVNPHDSEEVATTFHRFKNVDEAKEAYRLNLEAEAGFIGRKKPADDLTLPALLREAADLLLEEGYADHDLVPAKLYAMANKLEGK